MAELIHSVQHAAVTCPQAAAPHSAMLPLVLLHGWGVNHAIWQPLLARLPAELPVVCLDLPGFGLAQNCPEPYELAAVVEQLAAQITTPVVIAGWSLGGLVGVALAQRYPERIKGLALIASSPWFMAQSDWPGMQLSVLQQFSSALQGDWRVTVDRFLAIQAMGSPAAKQDIKQIRQLVLALPDPALAALVGGLKLLAEHDLRTVLQQLSIPVTAALGRLDALVPIAITPLLQQLRPDIQIQVFDQSSHAPFISQPDDFAQWLVQWHHRCQLQDRLLR
jgi:pimeloyl-[acyl-carrier protein] methyl ester esterase